MYWSDIKVSATGLDVATLTGVENFHNSQFSVADNVIRRLRTAAVESSSDHEPCTSSDVEMVL